MGEIVTGKRLPAKGKLLTFLAVCEVVPDGQDRWLAACVGCSLAGRGMLADGGITSRSGSFGWSWWTPWIIQCSFAPIP